MYGVNGKIDQTLIMRLMLFGTAGCHLCEQAEEIINNCLVNQQNVVIERVDIAEAENEPWQERYAVRIPVLYHADSQKELAWPFDGEQASAFILSLI
jgi:hypothetical protein